MKVFVFIKVRPETDGLLCLLYATLVLSDDEQKAWDALKAKKGELESRQYSLHKVYGVVT